MRHEKTRVFVLFLCLVGIAGRFPASARIQESPRQKTVEIFYTTFTSTQCWTTSTTKTIAGTYKGYDNRLTISHTQEDLLYKPLDQRGVKAKFNSDDVRLFVPAQNGHPEYAVDSTGTVRVNGSSYVIQPVALLKLSYLLDPLLIEKMNEYARRVKELRNKREQTPPPSSQN